MTHDNLALLLLIPGLLLLVLCGLEGLCAAVLAGRCEHEETKR